MAIDPARLLAFVEEIALVRIDGDTDESGEEFDMENDDAWSTLYRLVHEARELTA